MNCTTVSAKTTQVTMAAARVGAARTSACLVRFHSPVADSRALLAPLARSGPDMWHRATIDPSGRAVGGGPSTRWPCPADSLALSYPGRSLRLAASGRGGFAPSRRIRALYVWPEGKWAPSGGYPALARLSCRLSTHSPTHPRTHSRSPNLRPSPHPSAEQGRVLRKRQDPGPGLLQGCDGRQEAGCQGSR